MKTDLSFLTQLETIIQARLDYPAENSYTSAIAAEGGKRLAQKVGEEALELALASVAGDRREQLEEAADLVFHLLVLLRSKGLSLGDVAAQLSERHQQDIRGCDDAPR